MPVIKDPIHNHDQGRYGVVWCENDSLLAVYDKKQPGTQLLHLPSGWKIDGTLQRLSNPLYWCGVRIDFQLNITNANLNNDGPITVVVEKHIKGNKWFNPDNLKEPRDGIFIFPL